MNDYFMSVFVQLSHESIKSTRDIIVGVIYRKLNTDIKSFVHETSNMLSLLQQKNKVVYIMGDCNITLLNVHTHIPTADFIDMMSHRVTGNTATLIDNIFCNDVDCLDMMNRIFYNDISDYFPIFSINFKGHIADTKQYITKRI